MTAARLTRILAELEKLHGRVKASKPASPWLLILRRNCGYPASDKACAKGFAALRKEVGTTATAIAKAPQAKLARAARAGGMMPELRADRLRDIAALTLRDYGGDLRALLSRPLAEARKLLKQFPTIGDPGADMILLFTHTAPIAALPSNALQVPLRLGLGTESKAYSTSYRSAQAALAAALPETFDARIRAYTLLKEHGQEIFKPARPLCERCPVTASCAYYQTLSHA